MSSWNEDEPVTLETPPIASAHTPEPWTASAPDRWDREHYLPKYGTCPTSIGGADDTEVLDFNSLHDGAWLKPADARRIVACVNACAGLSTERLEAGDLRELLSVTKELAGRAYGSIEEALPATQLLANLEGK